MTEYKKEPNHVPCLLRKINLFEQPTYVCTYYILSPSITHPRLAAYYDRPTKRHTTATTTHLFSGTAIARWPRKDKSPASYLHRVQLWNSPNAAVSFRVVYLVRSLSSSSTDWHVLRRVFRIRVQIAEGTFPVCDSDGNPVLLFHSCSDLSFLVSSTYYQTQDDFCLSLIRVLLLPPFDWACSAERMNSLNQVIWWDDYLRAGPPLPLNSNRGRRLIGIKLCTKCGQLVIRSKDYQVSIGRRQWQSFSPSDRGNRAQRNESSTSVWLNFRGRPL